MARRDPNWAQIGNAAAYCHAVRRLHRAGFLTTETQTVRWFACQGEQAAVEHVEHKRTTKVRTALKLWASSTMMPGSRSRNAMVKPTYWAMAEIV
jgi:hypothetical protein